MFEEYHRAVEFLESIRNFPVKDKFLKNNNRQHHLPRFNFLLKLLRQPQKKFKFIQVTGTGGKGSTVNYLHSILKADGYKTGSYYSPHVSSHIERIKVGDRYISPKDFARLVDFLKPYLNQVVQKSPYGHPSYFETLLALSFLYYKEQKAEYIVLEAGLGGENDASNIVQKNQLAIITNVDYDHTDVLGRTLKEIAREKSGIIKKGSIFITGETRPELLKIFKRRCRKVKAAMQTAKSLDYGNADLIVTAGKALKLSDSAIKKGLRAEPLPCRMEIMQKNPLVIIDGAHNPLKLRFLKERLKDYSYRKLHLIFGMSADKDFISSAKVIVPLADRLWLSRFTLAYRKTADLQQIYQTAKKIQKNLPVEIETDPRLCLAKALKKTAKNDCLLITGSFYLAGELRKNWISEERILKSRKSF